MVRKTGIKVMVMVLAAALLVALRPGVSFAWWDDHRSPHHYRYHDRPREGLHLSFIATDVEPVAVSGSSYYYSDGLYYARAAGDYVLVAPPVGAVVRVIPPEFRPVIINGITYYTDNGIYYVYTRYGYQVVPSPVTVVQPPPVIVQQPAVVQGPAQVVMPATTSGDEPVTVNIPNAQGGYSSVIIKRSGKGYVGPQGEFYPEFPKVSQLQAMYGK